MYLQIIIELNVLTINYQTSALTKELVSVRKDSLDQSVTHALIKISLDPIVLKVTVISWYITTFPSGLK